MISDTLQDTYEEGYERGFRDGVIDARSQLEDDITGLELALRETQEELAVCRERD